MRSQPHLNFTILTYIQLRELHEKIVPLLDSGELLSCKMAHFAALASSLRHLIHTDQRSLPLMIEEFPSLGTTMKDSSCAEQSFFCSFQVVPYLMISCINFLRLLR